MAAAPDVGRLAPQHFGVAWFTTGDNCGLVWDWTDACIFRMLMEVRHAGEAAKNHGTVRGLVGDLKEEACKDMTHATFEKLREAMRARLGNPADWKIWFDYPRKATGQCFRFHIAFVGTRASQDIRWDHGDFMATYHQMNDFMATYHPMNDIVNWRHTLT